MSEKPLRQIKAEALDAFEETLEKCISKQKLKQFERIVWHSQMNKMLVKLGRSKHTYTSYSNMQLEKFQNEKHRTD